MEITTGGVESAPSVLVTALVGKSGGFAVEVVPAGDASGRGEAGAVRHRADEVQVEGELAKAIEWRCRRHEWRNRLELDRVTRSTASSAGSRPQGVSFSVRRGELVAIVGPPGRQGSTLLHVMGTLSSTAAAMVRIGGVDARGRATASCRCCAPGDRVRFQQFFLAEHATVRENVADGLLCGRPRRAVPARGCALERLASPNARASSPPSSPGGEAAVAIARALVGRPAIVLADEPTEPRQHHRRIDHGADPRAQRRRRHHH